MNCEDYVYWCFAKVGLVDATDLRRLFQWQHTHAVSGSSIDWTVVPPGYTVRRELDGKECDGDIVFFEKNGFAHTGILTSSMEERQVRHLWTVSGKDWFTDCVRQDSLDLLVAAAGLHATYVPFPLAWKTLRSHLGFCDRDAPEGLTSDAFWALFRVPPRNWLVERQSTEESRKDYTIAL